MLSALKQIVTNWPLTSNAALSLKACCTFFLACTFLSLKNSSRSSSSISPCTVNRHADRHSSCCGADVACLMRSPRTRMLFRGGRLRLLQQQLQLAGRLLTTHLSYGPLHSTALLMGLQFRS